MLKVKKFILAILVSFFIQNLSADIIYPSQCTIPFNSLSESATSITELDVKWELYWDKTPQEVWALLKEYNASSKNENASPADALIKVPGFWGDTVEEITGTNKSIGKGTYRLVLTDLYPDFHYGLMINESPSTSSAVYINGKELAVCGDPYQLKKGRYHSSIKPIYVNFQSDAEGNAEIIVFVHNYFYRIGGLWDTVRVGPDSKLFKLYTIFTGFYLLALGILAFVGVLNLIQFFMNKHQRQYMYLFLIALACACRISVAGFNSLGILFPNIPGELKIKIEYVALWLIPAAYYLLLIYLYSNNLKKIFHIIPVKFFRYPLLAVTISLGIASLITPARISNKLVTSLEICTGVSALYAIVILVYGAIKKQKYVGFHFASIGCLFAGLICDIVFSRIKGFLPISFVPIFLALFSTVQLLMLSTFQQDLFLQSDQMASDLQNLNISYIRFVPYEFLKLLKKDSITNIKLGDHAFVEMSILFCKVSIYNKKTSSSADPKTQYLIYCEFLKNVSPYITRNNGFISKFLSGGIMALFPENHSADDAIYSALKLLDCINELNEKYKDSGIYMEFYAGVHYGNMILGTIGDENRLDDTVISDTVNTVARIEAVCERLNKPVIISDESLRNSTPETLDEYIITPLQNIPIKGKRNQIKLFGCEFNKAYTPAETSSSEEIVEELEEIEYMEEVE